MPTVAVRMESLSRLVRIVAENPKNGLTHLSKPA
jgi:hypothetical protein